MSDTPSNRSLLYSSVQCFYSCWKSLVLTDVLFKLIAFVALTPLVGIIFHSTIAVSGNDVVSDLDILFLFFGPVGIICAILVGGVFLAIVALEQASLLAITCASKAGKKLGVIAALQFSVFNAWSVLRLTTRIVTFTLLAIVPFSLLAASYYFVFLTDYDINYYLTEKPTSFKVAVGVGSILIVALVVILLRMFSSWFFALPVLLFEDTTPRGALKTSTERAQGNRRTLLLWMVVWATTMVVLSMLTTGIFAFVGRVIITDSTNSLHLLAGMVGLTILLLTVSNLAINVLGASTFATMSFRLYQELGRDDITNDLLPDIAVGSSGSMTICITKIRLLTAAVAGSLVAIGVGATALTSVRLNDNVQIMAHRGSSKAAPENTLAAFEKAIEEEADWIELDVQESADGEVVVFHDSDFMKLAGQNLKIWDAKEKDLNEIDIGTSFSAEFRDERVPTLAKVLELCKDRIKVNIELKYYGHDQQLEQRVAEIVQVHGMSSDVMAMSLKIDGVKKMKSIRPNWKVGLLMSVSAGDLSKIEADFLAINADFANRSLIRKAHAHGKDIYVWTVNDPATMSVMISRGVDGLLTDNPALARSVLRQRSTMSAAERLLLEIAVLLGSTPPISDQ